MMWTLKWSVAVGLLALGAMPVQAVTDRQMMEKNCWVGLPRTLIVSSALPA